MKSLKAKVQVISIMATNLVARTTPQPRFCKNSVLMTTSTSHDGSAWYFGYGANMAASVFIERREIRPLRTEAAYIPSHALCFNVLGIPYVDPGNGGIRPLDQETADPTAADPTACVHGVAYLLAPDHLKKVVLSEGCVAVPIHLPFGPPHGNIHPPDISY